MGLKSNWSFKSLCYNKLKVVNALNRSVFFLQYYSMSTLKKAATENEWHHDQNIYSESKRTGIILLSSQCNRSAKLNETKIKWIYYFSKKTNNTVVIKGETIFVLGTWFQEETDQISEIKTSADKTKTRRQLIHIQNLVTSKETCKFSTLLCSISNLL